MATVVDPSSTHRGSHGDLWRRWVAANSLSEALGLGLTLVLTGLIFSRMETVSGVGGILVAFAGAVAAGVIEATLVGGAQWWAMHPWLPSIGLGRWWLGTLGGAFLAYVLGYLPSTLFNLGAATTDQGTVAEPSPAVTLLLAAGLGFVAGAILSWTQWLVLRRHISHACWWIPANMLAWSIGMPIIFWAVDLAYKMPELRLAIVFGFFVLLVTGAVVGAIHGAVLVRLVDRQGQSRSAG